MAEPIDTNLLRHRAGGVDSRRAELMYGAAEEIDRLRAERDGWKASYVHALSDRDTVRAAHNGLLRRLRDEMQSWRPEHPGAKECATRVLRALGDEVGD